MSQGHFWNPLLFLRYVHDSFQYAVELLMQFKYAVHSQMSLNIDEKSIIMHFCEVSFSTNSDSWNQIPLKYLAVLLLKSNCVFSHMQCLNLNEKSMLVIDKLIMFY